ncbi:hypothetical protein Athai_09980 [Actinocatenispora thailandica]|uniref:CHAT domain-containing protein n=1 Tax=Actinocatenispora thailandica TaxID=227318 RepID=A0A7R7DKR4_9ACTN|nr:CHAT domain-containing protein [Actinocatenispora thailandica]BCJ33495.1 hypothetical protein Athai_09980 [Actinocatenispora thailandica]
MPAGDPRGSDEAALAWLRERSATALDEDEVVTLADLAFALVRGDHPRLAAAGMLGDAVAGQREVRRHRTTPDRIGDVHADRARIIGSWVVWQPLVCRIVTGLLTALIAAAFGLPFASSLLLGGASATLAASTQLPARRAVLWGPWLLGIPCAALALWFARGQWWLGVLLLPAAWTAHHAVTAFAVFFAQGRRHLFGFVPFAVRLRLGLRGRWKVLATGLDKAVTDDVYRADRFLDVVAPTAPPVLVPVIAAARAVAACRRGETDLALRLVGRVLGGLNGLPPRCAGWVLLQASDVLVTCGRVAEAETAIERALAGLHPRRDDDWYDQALGRRVMLHLGADGGQASVLRDVHRLRLRAVRRADVGLLNVTETWLLRMALLAGDTDGTLRVARAMLPWSRAHTELGVTSEQLAARQVLLAQILLAGADRDRAVDLAFAALDALRGTHQPLAEAAARVTIARGLTGTDPADALAHVLAALRTVQDVRYRLPSAAWRGSWAALHAAAYALALDLAYSVADVLLVVELLEAVKSQSVPLPRDARSAERVAVLDALLNTPVLAGDRDASEAGGAADPLHYVPAVTVARACWSTSGDGHPVDLSPALDAIAPQSWYWSGIVVDGRYYYAVRDPGRGWYVNRKDGAAVLPALDALLDALPVPRPGESDSAAGHRAGAGPLGRDRTGAGRELTVLRAAAEALLPPVLRDALAGARPDAPVRLLVGLGGELAALPVAGWPLGPAADAPRLVEHAVVSYTPSIALLAAVPRQPSACRRYPIELALLGPDQDDRTAAGNRLRHALTPPGSARRQHAGALDKHRLRELLIEARDAGSAGHTLYVAGHVVRSELPADPGGGGLALAGGDRLTLRDLTARSGDGPAYPMPARVLLAGCGSIGVESTGPAGQRQLSEWLGLAAGVIAAGAEDVVCTLHPIPELPETAEFDLSVADLLVLPDDPAAALRTVQLRQLARWRSGDRPVPLVWQAYAHVHGAGPAATEG